MNTLNKVKEVADKSHIADDDDGADDYDFWQNLDVTKLKRLVDTRWLIAIVSHPGMSITLMPVGTSFEITSQPET